jgi:DNA-binding IclR family transcriptional regulator
LSTVGKAISLLELFSVDEPELCLTEIVRRSGFDKEYLPLHSTASGIAYLSHMREEVLKGRADRAACVL